ncbi:MAG: hypothetical protein FJ164_07965 [Gammaproteobacteria bacterium]|nr:hypothetical protein [Gammaproteobacteria bacterium]
MAFLSEARLETALLTQPTGLGFACASDEVMSSPPGRYVSVESGEDDGEAFAGNSRRNCNTLKFPSIWEHLNDSDFNPVELDGIKIRQGSGDPRLFNQYSLILVSREKHPHVKTEAAQRFVDYMTSAEGQAAIAAFRVGGESPFKPNYRGESRLLGPD